MILIWGRLIALFVIANWIGKDDKALAFEVMKYGLGLWVLGILGAIFVFVFVGKSVKETAGNVVDFVYFIAVVLVCVVILGVFSMMLPGSCQQQEAESKPDRPYRR